jgi:DNA-binding CsgD family transcriptional regulator
MRAHSSLHESLAELTEKLPGFDDQRGWRSFLSKLADEFAGVPMIGVLPREPGTAGVFSGCGIPESEIDRFARDFAGRDPLSLHAMGQPAGEVVAIGENTHLPGLGRTAFYTEWMEPCGLSADIALVSCLGRDGAGAPVVLLVMQKEGASLRLDAATAILPSVLRQLRQSILCTGRLVHSTCVLRAWQSFLETVPAAVFLLDEHLGVVGTNTDAKCMLVDGDPLHEGRRGLEGSSRQLSKRLRRFLEDAVDAKSIGERVTVIENSSSGTSIELYAVPLNGEDELAAPDAPALALLVRDRARAPAPPFEVVQTLYDLTPAEARLASLLAEGESLAEAASTLSITVETARSRLRSVFLKTGTVRQSELVWRLLSGVGPLARPKAEGPTARLPQSKGPPERTATE